MTLQNRVRPTGEIVAEDWRGDWTGNRGILHDAEQRLGKARWKHPHWVTCRLSFKGRKREVMRPGRYYTELFFFDEPCALAAGHRPCGECRREDYLRFRAAWDRVHGPADGFAAIDRALHAQRVDSRTRQQIRHQADPAGLPDGTMILAGGEAALIWGGALRVWTPAGYLPPRPLPRHAVTVCTPAPVVAVLHAGYRPVPRLDPMRG